MQEWRFLSPGGKKQMKFFTMFAVAALTATTSSAASDRPPAPSRLLTPIAAEQKVLNVFGQRIAYYEGGRGPTLILIPHLGWDSHMWGQNFERLAAHAHVIAWDPLGHGSSDKPMIDYQMNTWTDFLAEFMRLKNIERAFIGGTGMGGALAIQMALDHPERVSGVIVGASNSGPGPHLGGSRRDAPLSSLAGSRELLSANFFDQGLITETLVRARLEYRMRTNDGHVITSHMADHRPPYSVEELSRINVPAQFIWCREDELTPLSWGEDFARALPRGRLAVLERCGHFPNMEQPAQFDRAVIAFLRSADPG